MLATAWGALVNQVLICCTSLQPNYEVLDRKVIAARQIQLEAKKKSKGLFSERDTPKSNSGQSKY